MARARNIKPGFFRNEELSELDPLTRILFAGLWTIADREGRLEDRPKRIKADVLPYDDGDVDTMLRVLAEGQFIARYEHGAARYIQICNFAKHQNPHKNEAPSEIPSPETPETRGFSEKSDTSTVQAPEQHSTNRADSLNLVTDSLNSDSGLLETDSVADATEPAPKSSNLSKIQEQRFNRWYAVYPRKVGPLEAVRAWAKITPAPTDEITERMIAKVQEWTGSEEWSDPQFIPHPATWLNKGRWDDAAPTAKPRNVTRLAAPPGKGRQSNGYVNEFDEYMAEHFGSTQQHPDDDDAIDVKARVTG